MVPMEGTGPGAVPAALSQKDLEELADGIALLNGDRLTKRWTRLSFTLTVTAPRQYAENLLANDGRAFLIEGTQVAMIGGEVLPLGQIRTHIPAARVENLGEVLNRLRTGEDDEVATLPWCK